MTEKYIPKTDNELRQMAIDIVEGHIFTSAQIHDPSMTRSVFMPLALMTRKQIKGLIDSGAFLFYERVEKATPVSVNGLPCFMSVSFLTKADATRLDPMIREEYDKKNPAATDAAAQ